MRVLVAAVALLTVATIACQREVASRTCASLVVSSAEAICILRGDILPISVVGANSFGKQGITTLRERLLALHDPFKVSEDSRGIKWFHFVDGEIELGAGCVPTGSANDTGCDWHLRTSGTAIRGGLDEVLADSRKGGFRDGVLNLATPSDANSFVEAVAITVESGNVTRLDWFDPRTTRDLKLSWPQK